MFHDIPHRFRRKMNMATMCDVCERPIYISGYRCGECSYTCHVDCRPIAPNSCGLPPALLVEYKALLFDHQSLHSSLHTLPRCPTTTATAAFYARPHYSTAPKLDRVRKKISKSIDNLMQAVVKRKAHSGKTKTSTVKTNKNCERDCCRTSPSSSLLSLSTLVPETTNHSNRDTLRRSAELEWIIPYEQLRMKAIIGAGRFGTVYRADWFGPVAVKKFELPNDACNNQNHKDTIDRRHVALSESFRETLKIYRKTRHENLVLFMGAVVSEMDSAKCENSGCNPFLAIVTFFCPGRTLYTRVHERGERFSIAQIRSIAEQACRGIGYLHARAIVHANLCSKNIFYQAFENEQINTLTTTCEGRVVITDFGEFPHLRRLPYQFSCKYLRYFPPEIMQILSVAENQRHFELPKFTFASDIYAFGTILYEMLHGHYPWLGVPCETIIWSVGRGLKPFGVSLQANREICATLLACWTYDSDRRPDFGKSLPDLLQRIPLLPQKPILSSASTTTAPTVSNSPIMPISNIAFRHLSISSASPTNFIKYGCNLQKMYRKILITDSNQDDDDDKKDSANLLTIDLTLPLSNGEDNAFV